MQETIQQETTDVALVYEKSVDVIKSAGDILNNNTVRKSKAIEVGRNILAAIQENGMTKELDERAMKYLANVSTALKEMKESRGEVTQIMDALKAIFTKVENELDTKKTGTVPALIQIQRDAYAKQLAEEAKRKAEEAEMVRQKAEELINIKSHVERSVNSQFQNWLLEKKQKMQAFFNGITLDVFDDKAAKLKDATISTSFTPTESLVPSFCQFHSADEVKQIATQIIEAFKKDFEATAVAEMTLLKDDLIERLPSKRAELEEQKRLADAAAEAKRKAEEAKSKAAAEKAKAEAAEAKRKAEEAAAEQKRREEEEQKRLADAAAEAKRKAEEAAEIKAQGEQTMVMFEAEATKAESAPAPETRQGYEIQVLHAAGYVQIFQLWFENEANKLPLDKIGNTKLDQAKAWCEKIAHKTGEKIESRFLKYEPTYKAVNKKSK